MVRAPQSPLTFLYIGLGWLILSSLLGLAILIGIVRGTPLPPALRLIHVHGALVGGILQILLAGVLMGERGHISTGTRTPSFGLMLVLLNAATIGLSVGFWLRDHRVVGGAGLLLLAALLMSARTVWQMIRQADRSFLHRLYFALSVGGLYAGIGVGLAISFQLVQPWHGHARLGHIHLTVFLFAILSLVGLVRVILPAVLRVRLRSAPLDPAILTALLLGTAGLLTGFLLSSISVQLVAGGVLLIGLGLNVYDLFRCWLDAGQPGNAWSDHLLVAMFFLLLTALLGIAVGINSLWYPPTLALWRLAYPCLYSHGICRIPASRIVRRSVVLSPDLVGSTASREQQETSGLPRVLDRYHEPVARRADVLVSASARSDWQWWPPSRGRSRWDLL